MQSQVFGSDEIQRVFPVFIAADYIPGYVSTRLPYKGMETDMMELSLSRRKKPKFFLFGCPLLYIPGATSENLMGGTRTKSGECCDGGEGGVYGML